MEPHPIPQDVTSFQFHLVGDMTLKQFMYLAIGSSLAYMLFVFLAPSYPLLAWPIIIISALSGVAFAFLPIGSRPLDYWLIAFLKAIYSPTKRTWKKGSKTFKEDALFSSRLAAYLSNLQPKQINQIKTEIPIKAANPKSNEPVFQRLQLQTNQSSSAQSNAPIPSLLTTAELGKTVDLARQAQNLKLRIIQTEHALNQIQSEASQPNSAPMSNSQEVNKIIVDLQNLVSQASQIRAQLDTVTHEPPKIGTNAAPVLKEKVRVITPAKPKQTQLALTTFPNIISGIIKDSAGNYLEGAIAVIYDKEGLPVRALKTNKLGQFTGSTPLPSGIYKLVIEKDNLNFDILQIELVGELLPPLMITSK